MVDLLLRPMELQEDMREVEVLEGLEELEEVIRLISYASASGILNTSSHGF
jgi:hypothetical protein